jgi:hypothetical protein
MSARVDNTPFVVLGAARSGTTMLRLMLDRHSRLVIPFESHFLRLLFEPLPSNRLLTPGEAAQMAELVVRERNFPTWHFEARAVRDALVRSAPATLAELVDALFRMEIVASGKPRWGDKTPVYHSCWRELTGLFPGSKLVHIIRDGRDVSQSLERVGWHGPTAYRRARYCSWRFGQARAAERELGQARNLIIRYEDLVLATASTLQRVCDFLGERY